MSDAGVFAAGVNSGSRTPSVFAQGFQALRESSCPSRNHRLLPALANNSIGHHRDKLGAGYACSMQAMSCASRAMPDLLIGHHRDKLGAGYACSMQAMSCASRAMPDLLIGHHRDKLGAGYARPMRALAVARRPDGRPPPLACFLNASRLRREPLGRLSCNNTERAAEKPVVPVASRDRSGERRTNKQRKSQEVVRPREAHAGSTTPPKDYYVGAGGVQRAFAHHVSPVGTSPKAKMMGKR